MRKGPLRRLQPLWILLVCLVVVVAGAVLLWLLPAVLTRHPSAGMTPAERLRAINDARTPLIGFAVLVGSAVTIWFSAQTYRLGRQGQVTDRYTKAVGHLGEAQMPVRVGGLYALERIAMDSARDRDTIIYVLGAFVRERSVVRRDPPDRPAEDVRAAIRVAGRLLSSSAVKFNLCGADLRNIDLTDLPRDRVMIDDETLLDPAPPE